MHIYMTQKRISTHAGVWYKNQGKNATKFLEKRKSQRETNTPDNKLIYIHSFTPINRYQSALILDNLKNFEINLY